MGLSFSIHFKGDLLPGHTPEQAKASLAALFKIPPAQCEPFFSGVAVVIRRGVPAVKLPLYLKRLQEIGLEVEAVPEESLPAAPRTIAAPIDEGPPGEVVPAKPTLKESEPLSAAPALTETMAVEEISCPKCGERQPKRTLCRQCSTDMPRYSASEAAPHAKAPHNPYASSQTALNDDADDLPAAQASFRYFGMSLDARIGRLDYVSANLMYLTAMFFGVSLIGWSNMADFVMIVSVIPIFVAMFWVLRMNILRLHDFGRSAWTLLWSFIPVVNIVLSLIMLFKGGDDGTNTWGGPPVSPAKQRRFAISAVACVISFMMLSHATTRENSPFRQDTSNDTTQPQAARATFLPVPMPSDVPENTILIVLPEGTGFEDFQRSQSLADKLASHNLKVLMRSEIPVPTSAANADAQTELKNLQTVLAGPVPSVFVAGKASANPNFAQVMAEYQRSQ